jgi:four helix bundle protein
MQNGDLEMEKRSNDISERLLDYGVEIINLTSELNKTMVGRHIAKQLLKSSTSAGANYEEACGAESRADFIHKLQIALKELRESLYGERLIKKSKIFKNGNLDNVIDETKQLIKIIAKSVITAKNNN